MRSFLLQHAAQYDAVVGRYHDQRTREQNHRGASKGCIERNTFPHKFKRVPREKTEDQGGSSEQADQEEEEEGDKCTICLCGKRVGVNLSLSETSKLVRNTKDKLGTYLSLFASAHMGP